MALLTNGTRAGVSVRRPLALDTGRGESRRRARYVVAVEPLASTPGPWAVAAVAPTLQGYLTGALPPDLPSRPSPDPQVGLRPGDG